MSLFLTADGSHSIYSEQYQVAYHSKHGAIQETQHVFIDAGLKYIAERPQPDIKILEIGFGTGLNAFMTYLEANRLNLKIDYTTLEAYPLSMETVSQLNYVQELHAETHSNIFFNMHGCTWENKHPLSIFFDFSKKKAIFEESILASDYFDIVYFDAFAPEAQPHLWEEKILETVYKSLKVQGILTTYCAKGIVKRRLKTIGFQVESLAGPPGKREMIRAIKNNI